MVNTDPRPIGKYLQLARRGDFGAPEGAEQNETITVPPHSKLIVDGSGRFRAVPFWTALTTFELLPAASLAAGKEPLLVTLSDGSTTEVIARSSKGGVNVKTQASTPADNNSAFVVSVAANAMNVPITATSQPFFACRVSLTQITQLFASFGLDENLTDPNPAGTAGDGAKFVFDPGNELSMGLEAVSGVAASSLTASGLTATFTTATAHGLDDNDPVTISGATQAAFNGTFRIIVTSTTTFTYVMISNPGVLTATGSPVVTYGAVNNWVLHQKKAGADVYQDSEVPVIAGVDYDLEIIWGADLIPKYYINGKLVGTGTVANTSAAIVGVVCGVQINAAEPSGQKDFDLRYVMVGRLPG